MRKSLLLVLLFVASNLFAQEYTAPKREFRGAWLSTVWAIDWPGNRDNTAAAEKSQKAQRLQWVFTYLTVRCLKSI